MRNRFSALCPRRHVSSIRSNLSPGYLLLVMVVLSHFFFLITCQSGNRLSEEKHEGHASPNCIRNATSFVGPVGWIQVHLMLGVSCTALRPSCSVLHITLKQLVGQSSFKMTIFRPSGNTISTMNHIQRIFMVHMLWVSLGDKNGSIRAWSTSLNSFPLVTQFLGKVNSVKNVYFLV